MSKKTEILEQMELLKNELNTCVIHNKNLKDETLINISKRIDDLVIRLRNLD